MHKILPWQEVMWEQVRAGQHKRAHAWLLHGPAGIGKVDFALAWAQSLLCESPAAGAACGACPACHWFAAGNHPDFRMVRPEALEDEAEAGGEEGGTRSAKGKAPSKDIRIEQIRQLQDWVAVATHRGGARVVLLYPAEAMNGPAANALLKTLEEPPPSTVFLLVTDRLDRLLPTVVSRCRKQAMPVPDAEQSLAWLESRGVTEAARKLAATGGAPLAVWRAEDQGMDVYAGWIAPLLSPARLDPVAFADEVADVGLPAVVDGMQKLVFDLELFGATGRLRYFPGLSDDLAKLVQASNTARRGLLLRVLAEQKKVANHPLNARLFLADLAIRYRSLFTPEPALEGARANLQP